MEGKIEFIYQFNDTSPKVSIVLHPEADIVEVVEAFESFLKASGYQFEGQLDFVDKE